MLVVLHHQVDGLTVAEVHVSFYGHDGNSRFAAAKRPKVTFWFTIDAKCGSPPLYVDSRGEGGKKAVTAECIARGVKVLIPNLPAMTRVERHCEYACEEAVNDPPSRSCCSRLRRLPACLRFESLTMLCGVGEVDHATRTLVFVRPTVKSSGGDIIIGWAVVRRKDVEGLRALLLASTTFQGDGK